MLKLFLLGVLCHVVSIPVEAQVSGRVQVQYCPPYCRGSSCWCYSQNVCTPSNFLRLDGSSSVKDMHIIAINPQLGGCQALSLCKNGEGGCTSTTTSLKQKNKKQKKSSKQEKSSEEKRNDSDEEEEEELCNNRDYKCTFFGLKSTDGYPCPYLTGVEVGCGACDAFGRCIKTRQQMLNEFCLECTNVKNGKCLLNNSVKCLLKKRKRRGRNESKIGQ